MSTKRYEPDQSVPILWQIEVDNASEKTSPEASKEAEITEQTGYRWQKESCGMKLDRAKWLNEGSSVRLRPEYASHFWSYDFVSAASPSDPIRLVEAVTSATEPNQP